LSNIASTAEAWGVALDSDLSDRVHGRWYWGATPTLGGTGDRSMVVGYALEDDSTVGCYLLLKQSAAGCFSYQTLYHGAEPVDRDFGTFAATTDPSATCVTSLTGQAVGFGQVVGNQTVACPLVINGRTVQDFAVELNSDCTGGACDLNSFYVGTPATSAVENYPNFNSYTLDYDDLVIDNLTPPGVGYVTALYPNGAGTNAAWSNTCGGLTYKITPQIAAFASYSVANRAPTPLELGCSDPNRPCVIDAFMVSDRGHEPYEAADLAYRMRMVGREGNWANLWVNAMCSRVAGHLQYVSCPAGPLEAHMAAKWGGPKGAETFDRPFGKHPLDYIVEEPIPVLAERYGLGEYGVGWW